MLLYRYYLHLCEKCECWLCLLSGCVLYACGTVSQPMDESDVTTSLREDMSMTSVEVGKSEDDNMHPGTRMYG